MDPVKPKAERVLEALLAKPELCHEVVRLMRDQNVRVAGPWAPDDGDSGLNGQERRDALRGRAVGEIWQHPEAGNWYWRVKDDIRAKLKLVGTETEAKARVDARLAEEGWIVAEPVKVAQGWKTEDGDSGMVFRAIVGRPMESVVGVDYIGVDDQWVAVGDFPSVYGATREEVMVKADEALLERGWVLLQGEDSNVD